MASWRRRKRKRAGYVRRSRAQEKRGWTLLELSALCGVSRRTLRTYLMLGLLPSPAFRGRATRYDRSHLVRVLAVHRLKAEERLTLAEMAARLGEFSPAELEQFATEKLVAGRVADALAGVLPSAASGARTSGARTPGVTHAENGAGFASITRNSAQTPPRFAASVPRWGRVELALGVELHVRDDASASSLELARQVWEFCAAKVGIRADGRENNASGAATPTSYDDNC